MALLPVADAQARMLALATPLPAEEVALPDGAGRFVATDLIATRRQPAADLSAMDGYAIRFADRLGPWCVMGESKPGSLSTLSVGAGEAVRIFTGAALPDGADTILIQEDCCVRDGAALALTGTGPHKIGQHVRKAGGDFTQSQILVAGGLPLTPARIALAVLGGHATVAVGRRPRVALISTGDELVAPGEPADGVRLPASNAVMLRAMLEPAGAIVEDLGIVRDDFDSLARAFGDARNADVIVTTGGASVGDHDLVKPVLQSIGAVLDFWKIGMKPGKPLMAGKLGGSVVLGLPGNPVSAFVTGTLFLLPLVRQLQGAALPLPDIREARLAAPIAAGGDRAEYLRGIWRPGGVVEAVDQDSAAMVALASANVLIARAQYTPAAQAGEFVEVISLA